MATNIGQEENFADTAITTNAKNTVNNVQLNQRKYALGDIKNAPIALDKPSVEKATIQDYIEQEFASSKYVDHFDVWANNLALSDEEIGRWITMLNRAQKMNPDDDVKPQPPYIEEEIPFDMTSLDDTWESVEAVPIPEMPSEPESSMSDSIMSTTFDDNSFGM